MAEESVLDTTVLIEAIDHGRHLDLLQNENSISVVSVYEFIRYKKKMLENKLLLENSFDVLPLTNPVLLKAAEIFVRLKERGLKVSENDIYIASTALAANMRLYTRDKDFLKIKKHFQDLKVQFVKD